MTGAYVLAGELTKAGGDYHIAFRNYEQLFHPLIIRKQRAAERFSASLTKKIVSVSYLRSQFCLAIVLMFVPFVANLAMGRLLSDPLTLPVYDLR